MLVEGLTTFPLRLDCNGAVRTETDSGVLGDLQELTGEEVDCGSAASRISESLLICSAVKAERIVSISL